MCVLIPLEIAMQLMRFVRALVVSLLALTSLSAFAQVRFVEGTHYFRLKQAQPVATGANVEVLEIFSYACVHCATFDPTIESWKAKKPKNAQLVYLPAIFNESWGAYARAFYAAQALNILPKAHGAMFKALHQERKNFGSLPEIASWYGAGGFGITAQQFTNAFNANGMEAKLQASVDRVPKYEVDGTPSVIVDGKYRVNMAEAQSPAAFSDVVNFLVAKAAAERPKAK
jgi:protein dithiol oxidoreductase (disulfide-forming)